MADEPIDVLFALHPKFNLLDFAGPLEVLTTALHDASDPSRLTLGRESLVPYFLP